MNQMKRVMSALLCMVMLCTSCCVAEVAAAFQPGTYTATVDGRNGPLTVEVEFSAAAIEKVTVLEHQETEVISDGAIAKIPGAIVDAQSVKVDSISGATITSEAIVMAVSDCIAQAGGNADALTAVEVAYEKKLTPGAYQATRHGHHSDVVVETVVTEDTIESVNIIWEGETYNIADTAFNSIPSDIVAYQSIGLDSITGATYTSRAILDAVEDCLNQAGGEVAVKAFSQKIPSEPWSEEEITETYDVVVVGSGMSGMAAALSAQEGGAKVAILEKLPYWGGVSATSATGFAYPAEDTEEGKAIQYGDLMGRFYGNRQGDTYMNGEFPHEEAVQLIVDYSQECVEWLGETVPLKTFIYDGPRYGEVQEDGTVETKLTKFTIAQFDMPDTIPNFGGMGFKLLVEKFVNNGGVMYMNTAADSLMTNEAGDVIGVKATGKGGHYTFNAKAVVLCTGGFGANPEMVAELAPAYIGERNVTLSSNTGDGIRMAREIGADVYDDQFMMGGSGHTILSDKDRISAYSDAVTPKAAVYVDATGMRVNSEDPMPYTNSTMHINPDSRDYYWVIVNEEVAGQDEIPETMFRPYRKVGTFRDIAEQELANGNEQFYKADTLAELANKIQMVPTSLMYTMNRYNELCRKGEDTDLFKSPQYLRVMEDGPWYAVKAYMSYFGTIGGVVTDDTTAAVLREDGSVINGLYAAGETSNHNYFNNFYIAAYAMGGALIFGRVAGTNAAAYAAQ